MCAGGGRCRGVLAALLKLGAHDLSGLNDICLVFLGVLAKGLDKGNQIIYAGGGKTESLGNYQSGTWIDFNLIANANSGECSITINGTESKSYALNISKSRLFQQIIFRTGKRFELGAKCEIEPGMDTPSEKPARFLLDEINVVPLKR